MPSSELSGDNGAPVPMAGVYPKHLFGRCSAQGSSFRVLFCRSDLPETLAAFTSSAVWHSHPCSDNATRISPVVVPAVVMWLVSAGSPFETAVWS